MSVTLHEHTKQHVALAGRTRIKSVDTPIGDFADEAAALAHVQGLARDLVAKGVPRRLWPTWSIEPPASVAR